MAPIRSERRPKCRRRSWLTISRRRSISPRWKATIALSAGMSSGSESAPAMKQLYQEDQQDAASGGALGGSPYGPAPVDAFEQHRQLRRSQRHRAGGRLRPHEAAAFQAFGKQAQPVSVIPED